LPTIADRTYFQYHRSEPTPALTITGPIRGKVNTHRWELIVSQRLERPDGSFDGVAIAPISLQHFERSYASVDVGRYGNITLFGQDGTILVRKPSLFIGERFPRAHLLVDTNVLAPSGWYMTNARADGEAHLFTYRRLHRYPLIVRVGVAESEYLAAWRSDTRTKAIALVVVITLVGTLAAELNSQIGQRKHAEERLMRLAMHDGLTGLANRRQFDDVLEREWRYASRDRSPLALLMIDVDHFKSYNDLYGHQHGDATLVSIAHAIAAELKRPGDLAARYGGEEFVVILHGTDVDSAFVVAERIRTAVAALEILHRGTPPGVATVSIGIAAMVPRRHIAPASLVEAADKALYEAKGGGRNRTASAGIAFVDADVE
jgi:diguanylate cyclase (GGDEF)-like protein